jgi:Ca2+-binding EF-hand superfamily protein
VPAFSEGDRLHSFSDEMLNQLRDAAARAFSYFDVDGNNSIDASELEQVLLALGLAPSKQEVHRLVERMDSSGRGRLGAEDFERVILPYLANRLEDSKGASEGRLKQLYSIYDPHNRGVVSVAEFSHILQENYPTVSKEEGLAIAEFLDCDGDGTVAWLEFKDALLNANDLPETVSPLVGQCLQKV